MLTAPWPDLDAIRNVTATCITSTRVTSMAEDFYEHHFPGRPIVPAVMLLSWLEHTAGLAVGYWTSGEYVAVVHELVHVTCIRAATPGDELTIEVRFSDSLQPEPRLGAILAANGMITRGCTRVLRAQVRLEVVTLMGGRSRWLEMVQTLGISLDNADNRP